jgi:NitT/TauT family transport system permease protein
MLPVVSILLGLVAWEIVGQAELSFAVPPFSAVVSAIFEVWGRDAFREALIDSLQNVAIALPISIVAGVSLGLMMGRFKLVEWMFDIYVNVFLSLPLTALIPVLLLVFGIGRTAIIVVIILYAFFVIVVNTFAGVRAADKNLVEMAQSFGAGEFQLLRRVLLPAALPLIFTGIRIAAGRSIKGVIIAEQIIGLVGLGGIVQRYGGAFQVEELYAVIIAIGILGLLSMESVRFIEDRALPWMRGRSAGMS